MTKQEYDGTVKGKMCTFCDLKANIGRPLNFLFCGVIKQQKNVDLKGNSFFKMKHTHNEIVICKF